MIEHHNHIPLLTVEGITGGYGDITVVRDVSFSVAAGTITAILGRNGAGKTTALRLVSGLNPLGAGSVQLNGVEIGKMRPNARTARGIAYVQEGKRVFRQRTVKENLILGSYSAKVTRREAAFRVEQGFERFPALRAKSDVVAGSLSGGQQQMLAIAQALAADPRVLVLDEPTTGLSPAIVGELFQLIGQLRDEGLGVLLVEQAVDFTLAVADTAVVMNLGSVVIAGPASDPATRRAVESTYVGELG